MPSGALIHADQWVQRREAVSRSGRISKEKAPRFAGPFSFVYDGRSRTRGVRDAAGG